MPSQTVRISEASHRSLTDLSRKEGKPMQAVLDEAIEEYRRKNFWRETSAAFESLRQNQRAWKQEQQERTRWDHALLDGVEQE
jgi:alpha-ketoglutarate-dependent taurine dioxygenase